MHLNKSLRKNCSRSKCPFGRWLKHFFGFFFLRLIISRLSRVAGENYLSLANCRCCIWSICSSARHCRLLLLARSPAATHHHQPYIHRLRGQAFASADSTWQPITGLKCFGDHLRRTHRPYLQCIDTWTSSYSAHANIKHDHWRLAKMVEFNYLIECTFDCLASILLFGFDNIKIYTLETNKNKIRYRSDVSKEKLCENLMLRKEKEWNSIFHLPNASLTVAGTPMIWAHDSTRHQHTRWAIWIFPSNRCNFVLPTKNGSLPRSLSFIFIISRWRRITPDASLVQQVDCIFAPLGGCLSPVR